TAKASPLHLRKRFRTPRSRQLLQHCRRSARSRSAVSRLANVLARELEPAVQLGLGRARLQAVPLKLTWTWPFTDMSYQLIPLWSPVASVVKIKCAPYSRCQLHSRQGLIARPSPIHTGRTLGSQLPTTCQTQSTAAPRSATRTRGSSVPTAGRIPQVGT